MLTNVQSKRSGSILVLGAGGFLGVATIEAIVAAGYPAIGIVRQSSAAARVEERGGIAVQGDATNPESWIALATNALAVIDLVQPQIPRRLGSRALARIVAERVVTTQATVTALRSIPAERRPLFVNVSGTADLAPDARGLISHTSALTSRPTGFARIGLAARAVVRKSGIDAAFVHLGTVYGPGKTFVERMLPALARGRYPIFGHGANRVAIVHVDDAARALAHIATSSRVDATRDAWIVTDQSALTLSAFLTQTAMAIAGPTPRHMPRWVGRVILGSGLMAELSKDVPNDSVRLVSSGFAFRYPRFREGLAATLAALGRASHARASDNARRSTSEGQLA